VGNKCEILQRTDFKVNLAEAGQSPRQLQDIVLRKGMTPSPKLLMIPPDVDVSNSGFLPILTNGFPGL